MAVSSVANSETFKTSTPSDREIVLTRLFDAPRDLVFDAMTTPEHVKRWWGCLDDRYSLPVCEIDLRPGGSWRYVGRSPQGEYSFYGIYREVSRPDRLVFTEIYAPYPDVESVVTAVFTEEARKTRMTLTALYPSKDVRDMVLSTGMERGAGISYDRLEELVAELQRA
jgi:uncharacterized protein YndB with AHSA1/START domain